MKQFRLVPPAPELCPECAIAHKPDQPHNPQSWYYQTKFYQQHGRKATWADAMAHCPEEVKAEWTKRLTGIGIDIHSTNLTGDISSVDDAKTRLVAIREKDDE